MTRVCNYDGCTSPASHARRLEATDTEYWYCERHDPLEDPGVSGFREVDE